MRRFVAILQKILASLILLALPVVLVIVLIGVTMTGKAYYVNEERSLKFQENEMAAYAELAELLMRDTEPILAGNPDQERVRYAIGYQYEHSWDEVFSGDAEGVGEYLPRSIRHLGGHEDIPVTGAEDILQRLAGLRRSDGQCVYQNYILVYRDQIIFTTDTAGGMLFYVADAKALPRDIDGSRVGGSRILYKLCDHWYEAFVL